MCSMLINENRIRGRYTNSSELMDGLYSSCMSFVYHMCCKYILNILFVRALCKLETCHLSNCLTSPNEKERNKILYIFSKILSKIYYVYYIIRILLILTGYAVVHMMYIGILVQSIVQCTK